MCDSDQFGKAFSLLVKINFFNWTGLITAVDGFKFESGFLFINDFLIDEGMTDFERARYSLKWCMFIKEFSESR